MNCEEFREILQTGGVDIESVKQQIVGRKPIYCYAAKGPILLEDHKRTLVAVLLDYKDAGYPLTPVVHNTLVFPGGRWEQKDETPQDTFTRERGEEYFIPQQVLKGDVVSVGDYYAQFPCLRHGIYADLTSIFANRVSIDALRDTLGVSGTSLAALVDAVNGKAQESRQRLFSVDQLCKQSEQYGFMDGGKLVRILKTLYGIEPKVSDTVGGVLIELPTRPTDTYESRRDVFTAYLHQNKLS